MTRTARPTRWLGLVRHPRFAAATVVSFALAVGANTAMFSVVNALWFRPLPVRAADRVVVVYQPVATTTDGALLDHIQRRDVPNLQAVTAFENVTFEQNLRGSNGDWRPVIRLNRDGPAAAARAVAHNYFDVLGIQVVGRTFVASDDVFGADAIAVVSHNYWRTFLGGASSALGQRIMTTRGPITIVGIAAEGFSGARMGDDVDIWLPFGSLGRFSEIAARPTIEALTPVTVYGRLQDGADIRVAQDQARRALNAAVVLTPLREVAFPLRAAGDLVRQQTLLTSLWMTALLVLLLGCANLTSLFLARYEERRHEFAVRMSLGSTPAALRALVVAECAALTLTGLVCGMLAAGLLLYTVHAVALPTGVSVRDLKVTLDWRVIAFGSLVAMVAALIPTFAAVRQTSGLDVASRLALGGRGASATRVRLRRTLLSTHIAVSMVLLVVAVGLVESLVATVSGGHGFDIDHSMFIKVRPRLSQYPEDADRARRLADYRRFLDLVGTLPGVQEAAYGPELLPADDVPAPVNRLKTTDGTTTSLPLMARSAGPGYLTVLRAHLMSGRDLRDIDATRAVDVAAELGAAKFGASGQMVLAARRPPAPAVIDTTLAAALWPDQSPIGKVFSQGFLRIEYEVVGVIQPIRYNFMSSVDTPTMVTFADVSTLNGAGGLSVVLRVDRPAGSITSAIHRIARDLFPDPSSVTIRSGAEILALRTARQRMSATFISWYALVSLFLAVLGIFGLVSQFLARSWRELGTRGALGATIFQLRTLVLRRTLGPVLVGTAIGGVLTAWLARFFVSSIPGFTTPGADVYAVALVGFLASAAAAAVLGTYRLRRWNIAQTIRTH